MHEKKRRLPRRALLSVAVILVLIPAVVLLGLRLGGKLYYLTGVAVILLTLIPFFLTFEARRPQARELTVLSVLCALTVASRAAFAAVPSFKPMTAVIMISGIAFGPEAGFLVGAVSGFASNFIFGQGPWTPWQMFAFGIAGFVAGGLQRLGLLPKPRLPLALFGFVLVVLVVGPILDTCTLFTMTAPSAASAATVYLAGIPMNLVHGAATALTLLLFGKPMLEKLRRLQVKYGMMEGGGDVL